MSNNGGVASYAGTASAQGWNVISSNDLGTMTHHDWMFT
jgi:hypothetical protein